MQLESSAWCPLVRVFSEVLGRHVEVPDEPSRIVSLAPAITDALYAVGAWSRVVGVSYFCLKPPEARSKPRVGSYFNVNYRLLEELNPDLVLVTTGAQRRLGFELVEKGYTVYPVPLPISVYGVLENILTVGLVVNRVEEARKAVSGLAEKLYRLSREPIRASVYYEVDLGEPITVGSMTYIDHALSVLGLENIYRGKRATYFAPDFEYVVSRDPDVIIYEPKPFSKYSRDRIIEKLSSRPGWSNMRAIRENRVVVLEPDSLAHYGPSLIAILEGVKSRVLEALHSTKSS